MADAELVLDDLGLPGGMRALTDSCLVSAQAICVVILPRAFPYLPWTVRTLLVFDLICFMARCPQVVDSLGVAARRQLLEEFVQTQLVAYDGELCVEYLISYVLFLELQ